MKRPVAALLSAVLLAAGCASAPPRYAKPDSTAAKAGEELESCRADSNEAMTEGAMTLCGSAATRPRSSISA